MWNVLLIITSQVTWCGSHIRKMKKKNFGLLSLKPHQGKKFNNSPATMTSALVGKWELESQNNFEAFMRKMGVEEEKIAKAKTEKQSVEITSSGDTFTITVHNPAKTFSNTITVGQENEIELANGQKAKGMITAEGGKLITKMAKMSRTSEVVGGKLIDVSHCTLPTSY
uniref:Fatty acid binding protein 6, ileal (gastrotropin) n=1 Tax=Eptatretus burgeri TaxID=7764 RepID=A0A8C4QXH3_EPTBU